MASIILCNKLVIHKVKSALGPISKATESSTSISTNLEEDLFSYKTQSKSQKLQWFQVLESMDCFAIPEIVNVDRPPRDICLEAAIDEQRCICINTGGQGSNETGYKQICGNCRDPCRLEFIPDVA